MDEPAREQPVSNVAGHMLGVVSAPVLERAFQYWRNIDEETGERIEKKVRQGG